MTRKQQHAALLRAARKRYPELVQMQGSERCAICFRLRNPAGRRLDIDHCHRLMTLRGLLCHICNRWLRDDPAWHELAADYLRDPPLKDFDLEAAA